MVVVSPAPSSLDLGLLSAYYAKDQLVGNLPVVAFHGPSTTTNSTLNSSRIQAHIFSAAGFVSFPRLTISPTSPLYLAVHRLPEDQQGDETCRGLAVSLFKYFSDLPAAVKTCLRDSADVDQLDGKASSVFDEEHAASLASQMVRVENPTALAGHVITALAEKSLSWVDIDVLLPRGSITATDLQETSADPVDQAPQPDRGHAAVDYGRFAQLVGLFGIPSFIPSSKLRRAPSKPLAAHSARALAPDTEEKLCREMHELVETEKGYVSKLDQLIRSASLENLNVVSAAVRESEQLLRALFYGCLSQIFDLNREFLSAIEDWMGKQSQVSSRPESGPVQQTETGKGGTDLFAKVLLKFLPRFKEPYQEYLKISSSFPKVVNETLRESSSPFAQALRDVGEQRLRSWLIEPVQRLPRYSLYIENMINQTPMSHPAMAKLLRAKDVVTDICALDSGPSNPRLVVDRLKGLTSKWPDALAPDGRLITIIDAVETPAPFRVPVTAREGFQNLLVLFASHLVVLRKISRSALSARGLFAEIDRPASAPSTISQALDSVPTKLFVVAHHFRLSTVRFTESKDGHMITVAQNCFSEFQHGRTVVDSIHARTGPSYFLGGSSEGKAARWSEQIAKARIEQRFPEPMRDSRTWALKSNSPQDNHLGLVSAVFEDDSDLKEPFRRTTHGQIEVLLHHDDRGKKEPYAEMADRAVEIAISVSFLEPGKYLLGFRGPNDSVSTDRVTASEFMPVFLKRLSNSQRLLHQPHSAITAQAHISFMRKIVETLRPEFPAEEGSMKGRFRPASPVKALTNLLGSSSKEQSQTKSHYAHGSVDLSKPLPPLTHSLEHREKRALPEEDPKRTKVTIVQPSNDEHGSLDGLETTMNTYVIALHSRAGNIVGRALRNRHGAEELKINELYNTLIEDPGQHQAAAEVPVDVLFAAFEKFLKRAWKERIGSILPSPLLNEMQHSFVNVTESQARKGFKVSLEEMAPQNRRAFSAVIRLLADLIDAAGNDGDRGALTASFAEALIEVDPHDFIPLIDRLVDDVEALFDGATPIEAATVTPASTREKMESTHTGSFNSTGSSLRKRFGLGMLTRENSKSDAGESRVGQIWRSLSKKASGDSDSQPGSLSKSFLSRSKSTDSPKLLASRPNSRDRPLSAHSVQDENKFRPGSAGQAQSRVENRAFGGLKEQDPNQLQNGRQGPRTPSPTKLQKLPPHEMPAMIHPSRKENVPPVLTLPALTGDGSFNTELAEARLPTQATPNIPERKSSSPQKLKFQSPQKVQCAPAYDSGQC